MTRGPILNPALASLLCRFRHTNALVIADRGFPFWPMVETIDLSIVDGVPSVLQVLSAIRPILDISDAFMAQEFSQENGLEVRGAFENAIGKDRLKFESHVQMKTRVPGAIGLIRTGDTIQYANVVLISGN